MPNTCVFSSLNAAVRRLVMFIFVQLEISSSSMHELPPWCRHGRFVWGVCRGLLLNEADAEDAFQATFVALFRGAARIRQQASLAPWLHATATRIARKVRLTAARRARRELCAARPETAPPVSPDETWESLNFALHEEIARLPELLRAAFVLCVLEGKRHKDAATQCGVPVGTLSARVSRARKRYWSG